MSDITGKEVEELLEKAWGEFRGDYNKKVLEYCESLGSKDEEKAKGEHWILWTEHDLVFQLGRFFYEQLAKNSRSGVEMHIDVKLKRSNFKGYKFRDKLKKLSGKLGKVPEVDLIIAQEASPERFLLCAEAKCFHYSVESVTHGKRTARSGIEGDLKRLVTIRDLGISESVAFIMLDDYYWIHNSDIENVAEKACKEHGIIPLLHNSKVKVGR